MKLCLNDLKNKQVWKDAGIRLPEFDIDKMRKATKEGCTWIHFGAGNIFRGFPAARMQDLLEKGLVDTGIVVGEGFDYEIIDRIYDPCDGLCLLATLKSDATVDTRVIASVAEAYRCNPQSPDYQKLKAHFINPKLQMVSFTITEKGYATTPGYVQADIERGPEGCSTIICMITSLAYERFKAGAYPFAFVSMDNCSKNGQKLQNGVMEVANAWLSKGLVTKEFIAYLSDPKKVAFPWSMIDKITPRPDAGVMEILNKKGFEGTEVVVTGKNTYIAPFVNAEECEYLVIEDSFPNGRPPLEKSGIYMTDRDTVNKVEKMKVCTCLNPLHTAMSVMGCLLGYTKISDEMKDQDIVNYIKRIGYVEGMPVVVDPGILSPKSFIDDVVERRLANPFMPDTPQRIATDTSQKLGIRFGETIKNYMASDSLSLDTLKCIPLVLASWMRYCLGVDDNGNAFTPSPDPLLEMAQEQVSGIKLGDKGPFDEKLKTLMENTQIWGLNLYESPLKDRVLEAFEKLVAGKGAVRNTIHEYTC
ncbi:MAG: mannitol dehydrogenase family protein [Sphaerochaetaceae bacterium]|nr:mannitol dehydrogenase family protein [Sphaerochaetaceae bacterium]